MRRQIIASVLAVGLALELAAPATACRSSTRLAALRSTAPPLASLCSHPTGRFRRTDGARGVPGWRKVEYSGAKWRTESKGVGPCVLGNPHAEAR